MSVQPGTGSRVKGRTVAAAPFLSIFNIRKDFLTRDNQTVRAIDDVSFDAEAGKITCIVGPTGSGKSTLLRLIAGLDDPDAGKVSLHEALPAGSIGYMTQEHSLFPWLRVKANIGLPIDVKGESPEERDRTVRKIAGALGITDALDRYPYELSGGMQRRTALGRLMASGSGCWLMDEPFSALDDRTVHQLQRLLLKLVSENGKTVVFVTHSIDEAVFLGDRIIVLSAGPCRVADIFDNGLAHPRDRLSPEFGRLIETVRCRLETVIEEKA